MSTFKMNNLATIIGTTVLIPGLDPANPATVNQDIMPYNFRSIDSLYLHTKSNKKKSQINDNLAAAQLKGTDQLK
jgi:hypothetical protein